jgi:hypothetical protein
MENQQHLLNTIGPMYMQEQIKTGEIVELKDGKLPE